jgi:uncharacterized protein YecT (DUF1311 family)
MSINLNIFYIKYKMKLTLIIGLSLFVTLNTFASCVKPAPGYDTTYCFAKLFVESDNELNVAYKNLNSILNPEQKKKLLGSQRSWIKFRNASCSDGGSINVDCNFEVNKKRTKFLLDRITECKIGACKNELLGDENFSN